MSSRVLNVEYDADEKVLRLHEPLEGVENHAQLRVRVEHGPQPGGWESLRRTVTNEQLDELAAIIDEMFPIEK